MRTFSRISVAVLLAVAVCCIPTPVEACAPAPMRGVTVDVADESAIIIWDASTKTQHFIRRATFQATSAGDTLVKDFGFLVPTPGIPELAEADDKSFDTLAKITEPRTVYQSRPKGGGCIIGCGGMSAPAAKSDALPAGVSVMAEKTVGGYDAKVLKATDENALTAWLNERGYEIRPALTKWMKQYIAKGWMITAFKIAPGEPMAKGQGVGSAAVRMTFKTETPFFPYSEPEDMRESKIPRLFRVFCISNERMSGKLDKDDWNAQTVWAGKPSADQWKSVALSLKIPAWQPDDKLWLTEFEDRSSPRKGEHDLTFVTAKDQTQVERPDRIIYTMRTDLGTVPAFAAIALAIAAIYLTRLLSLFTHRVR